MNWLKKMLMNLMLNMNKKGVTARVIALILLVVGLAIVVIFVLFVGRTGKESVLSLILNLNKVKQGGGG